MAVIAVPGAEAPVKQCRYCTAMVRRLPTTDGTGPCSFDAEGPTPGAPHGCYRHGHVVPSRIRKAAR